MSNYFFHIRKNGALIEDQEGVELPGARAALEEAKAAARELIAEKVRFGEVVDGDQFEVRDDLNVLLFTLPFKSVMKLE